MFLSLSFLWLELGQFLGMMSLTHMGINPTLSRKHCFFGAVHSRDTIDNGQQDFFQPDVFISIIIFRLSAQLTMWHIYYLKE